MKDSFNYRHIKVRDGSTCTLYVYDLFRQINLNFFLIAHCLSNLYTHVHVYTCTCIYITYMCVCVCVCVCCTCTSKCSF